MRGHLPLIAIRNRGFRPDAAVVNVGDSTDRVWATWHLDARRMETLVASIDIQPQDRISEVALELRCLVGIPVMVHGTDERRTIRIAELCVEAGCDRCFVTVHDPKTHEATSGFIHTKETPVWQQF